MGILNVLLTAAFPQTALPGEDIHTVYYCLLLFIEIRTPETENIFLFVNENAAVQCAEPIRRTHVKYKKSARTDKELQSPKKLGKSIGREIIHSVERAECRVNGAVQVKLFCILTQKERRNFKL